MDYAKLDIKTLFQLVNEKDPQALAELLVRFEPLIKSKSKYNGHVDEDIAQDIRETLFRALKKKILENA
ncbi:helix-turn-helix domain-containing protein [Desulfosporosinus sp. BG]|uniref:helix-turn-helix domain-containing protein n=1 Tax=Desulfosporosinus sp. BG TaxID=1633135 RepID=UPI00083B56BE|nr:helix-turn-helix domain-containing protein [Desulfosporosinus sp. BG]